MQEDPWRNIIAKRKYYHDVRVRGDKKNTVTYACFMETLSDRWRDVTSKCISAKTFERDLMNVYGQVGENTGCEMESYGKKPGDVCQRTKTQIREARYLDSGKA